MSPASTAAATVAVDLKAASERRLQFFTTQDASSKMWLMENEDHQDLCYGQNAVKEFYDLDSVQIYVAILIFLNFIVEAVNAQLLPEEGSPTETVFLIFEYIFNVSFLIELIVNMYGSWFTRFWASGWNLFDFIIVGVSIMAMVLPDLPGITVLRLFRAFRVFRLFKRIPSLKKIIEGVLQAIPGVTQAFVVMVILMGIWSVIGVEFFRTATPQEFGDFMRAMFTMFQVMTMDFSGIAREIMFDHGYPLAAIFFITYIFIAGIVMTNVVVAILLDRYLAAMEVDNNGPKQRQKNFPTIYLEVENLLKPVRPITWSQWEKLQKFLNMLPRAEIDDMGLLTQEAKPIEQWSLEEVGNWLKIIGYEDFVEDFAEEVIDGKWLVRLTEHDLMILGMKFGRRKMFMDHLYQLVGEENERIDRIKSLKEIFDEYDSNQNGLIEQDEFIQVWHKNWGASIPLGNDDIIETFNDINADGDGVISFAEFVRATMKLKEGDSANSKSHIELPTNFDQSMHGIMQHSPVIRRANSRMINNAKEGRSSHTMELTSVGLNAGFHGDHAKLCNAPRE